MTEDDAKQYMVTQPVVDTLWLTVEHLAFRIGEMKVVVDWPQLKKLDFIKFVVEGEELVFKRVEAGR